MTYDDAIEAMISVDEAIRECGAHGAHVGVSIDGTSILACYDNELIATIINGEVAGCDILGWLGY